MTSTISHGAMLRGQVEAQSQGIRGHPVIKMVQTIRNNETSSTSMQESSGNPQGTTRVSFLAATGTRISASISSDTNLPSLLRNV
jgi:hypothetical protein